MNPSHISALTQVLPVVVVLFTFKKLEKNFKLFALFCVFALLTEVVCFFLDRYRMNVSYMQNIYTLVEMACYFFLMHLTIGNAYISKFVVIAFLLCLFSWLVNFYALNGISSAFQYADTVYSFFIASFAAISLLHIASSSMVPLLQNSYYLRSIGFMFYFTSAVILYSLSNINFTPTFLFTRVWDVHAFTNGIANVIYAISIWQNSRIEKTY